MLFQPEEFVKEVDLKVSGRAQGPQLSTSSPPLLCYPDQFTHVCSLPGSRICPSHKGSAT